MTLFDDPRRPIDPESIRNVAHTMADLIADALLAATSGSVSPPLDRASMQAAFSGAAPEEGAALESVLATVRQEVVGKAIRLRHPRYLGHQVGPPLALAAMVDGLASAMNQGLAVWEMAPSGTFVEEQVVRWLLDAAGFPGESDGTLVSGGTVANLVALLAARNARVAPDPWAQGVGCERPPVVLCCERAHYSIERAAGLLGLGTSNLVRVPDTANFKMDVERLEAMIPSLRQAGRAPFAVVATAGCTPVGSFDPIPDIADVCARHGLWLHVDGAHGASGLFSPRLRPLLRGVERADSLTWDPHKLLWMPTSLGAVLVRRAEDLEGAFRQKAPYLFHADGGGRSLDPGVRNIQCTRRLDALKLWVCIRHYGTRFFGELNEHVAGVAHHLFERMSGDLEFEACHRPELNILCFRYCPERLRSRPPDSSVSEPLDHFNFELRRRLNRSGEGWITTTVLRGQRVLRAVVMNPRTTNQDAEGVLESLRRQAHQLLAEGHPLKGVMV